MSENDSKVTKAERIIQRLHQFNRKERDHLMKFALCDEPAEPKVTVDFWRMISGNQGLQRPKIPSRFFIGMDYHLNWLFAALSTAEVADDCEFLEKRFENSWGLGQQFEKKIAGQKNKNGEFKDLVPIQGNQEDVDLLSAWVRNRDDSPLCITLVEAKLDSQWSTEQLDSKMQRIALIQTAAYILDLGWIEWGCLLLSPTSAIKNESRNVEAYMQEEYPRMLREFCAESIPMPWKWESWNGTSPDGGRLSVNRLNGDHSRWRITS
jgi:hypothetical protein